MNEFAEYSEIAATSTDLLTLIGLGVLVLVLSITVYTEITAHRIPNAITLPALLLGVVIGLLPGGLPLANAIVGFLIGFGTFFVVYMFGGMGGGDVKLMGVVGILLGYPLVIPALIYTGFIGAVMAVVMLIWKRPAKPKTTDENSEEADEEEDAPMTIPYGVAIALGAILALMSGYAA